jgi:Photoprotection regulator fluorescence recovery protein
MRLHNFLSTKRHEIDGKYDYNYSVLVFVFATLIKQGWLHLDELKGLEQDKITKITSLSRM